MSPRLLGGLLGVAFVAAVGLHLARAPVVPAAPPVVPAPTPERGDAVDWPVRPVPAGAPGMPSRAWVHDAVCRGDATVVGALGRWLVGPLQPHESFDVASWLAAPAGTPGCDARGPCDAWSRAVTDPQGLPARTLALACGQGGFLATPSPDVPSRVPVSAAESWALWARRRAGRPAVPLLVESAAESSGAGPARRVELVAPALAARAELPLVEDGACDGAALVRAATGLDGP